MLTPDNILECIAEACRQARRSYTKPLDLSTMIIVPNEAKLILEILDPDGDVPRKFVFHMTEEIQCPDE